MFYIVLILSLLMPLPVFAQGAITVTLTSSSANYPDNADITLTATTTGGVSEVSFYMRYKTGKTTWSSWQFMETVTGSTPFTYVYPQAAANTYQFYAIAGKQNLTSGQTSINGPIDMVPDAGSKAGFPSNVDSPVLNSLFGANTFGSTTPTDTSCGPTSSIGCAWVPGDNQMCSQISTSNLSYNSQSSCYPDGSCEWTDKPYIPPPPPPDPTCPAQTITAQSSLDSLDMVLHTLSDFDRFAQSILAKDLGTLNASFHTWYPQAAGWIAPICTGACNADNTDNTGGTSYCAGDPSCGSGSCSDYACNPGSNGRLLNIYRPTVYPNISGYPSNLTTSVTDPVTGTTGDLDLLKYWKEYIINWLNNIYTPAGAASSTVEPWCVPPETALLNGNANTLEDTYITNNTLVDSTCTPQNGLGTPCPTWGDLPHVLACLRFNAGPDPAQQSQYANYQACLNAMASSCPALLPDPCAATNLGISATVAASNPANNGFPSSVPHYAGPDRCKVDVSGTFAHWVSQQFNFGPVYNYQNCLNFLTSTTPCPAALPSECSPTILGRQLLNTTAAPWSLATNTAPPFRSSDPQTDANRCDPTYTNPATKMPSYAQWVLDNLTLFQDEAPKFALRYTFLNDIYTRAKTLQDITASADDALHTFLKPCGNAGCTDGGPAAQLMYVRQNGAPAQSLPNSVIYGWVDNNLPNGGGGPGYAHIVKVTAFSTGRNGVYNSVGILTQFPWIRSYTSGFLGMTMNYELTDRDGYTFVSVQRWDQEHTASSVFLPNGRKLWDFWYRNPNPKKLNLGTCASGTCNSGMCSDGTPCFDFSICTSNYGGHAGVTPLGYGLLAETVDGLNLQKISGPDRTSLRNAFMLNDPGCAQGGNCSVDQNATNDNYNQCLNQAIELLNLGTESHACGQYVADYLCPVGGSGPKAKDYCVRFVDCSTFLQGTLPSSSP